MSLRTLGAVLIFSQVFSMLTLHEWVSFSKDPPLTCFTFVQSFSVCCKHTLFCKLNVYYTSRFAFSQSWRNRF